MKVSALLLALCLLPASVNVQVQKQPGESYPAEAQDGQTESRNTMEILPSSYLGCWRGVVTTPDSLQTLNGCLNGPFVPELYTLCYRKTLGGKFELTFSGVQLDTSVPEEYQIRPTSGDVQVLGSDGVAKVKLRSLIRFDQNQVSYSPVRNSKWSMDEQTDIECEMKDGDMQVSAAYIQKSEGAACFKGTWHTRFHRSDD